MKIIELKTENIKRLKAVRIMANGKPVVLGGKNDNGKTSVIDSISYVLGGADAICDEPIRRGEKRAEAFVDLGELKVLRKFTPNGSTLTVRNSKDELQSSPQAILDKLVGKLTFDPLEFSRMKPDKQRECLANLAGLNLSAINAQYQNAYDRRRDANREVDRIKATLVGKTLDEALPEQEVAASDLLAKMDDVRKRNDVVTFKKNEAVKLAREMENMHAARDKQSEGVQELRRQIQSAETALAVLDEKWNRAIATAEAAQQAVEKLTIEDEAPFKTELLELQNRNEAIRKNNAIRETHGELSVAKVVAESIDKELQKILDDKQKLIETAKFPLAGLSVSDDSVLFNGFPLQQASASQRLKISTAIGSALNPKLRVMLLREAAYLDSDSLADLLEWGKEQDVQLWIERVGTGEEVSVVIEDGEVKA